MRVRRLLLRTGTTSQILAEFALRGEELRVRWHDLTIKAIIESVGAPGPGRPLRPTDGRAFYDALDGAFSSKAALFVDEIETTRETLS